MYSYSINTETNSIAYQFNTKNNIHYTVLFDCINDNFEFINCPNIYTLTVVCTNSDSPPYDRLTAITIVSIIKNVFLQDENAFVVYYPDDEDGRDGKREISFGRWFEKHSTNDYEKDIYRLNSDAYVINLGVFCLIDNVYKEDTKAKLIKKIVELNAGKDSRPY